MPVGQEQVTVVGTAAAGSAPIDNPVQFGGSDGTNMRVLLVDTSGRVQNSESQAPGSAVPTRALYIGGSDGTNLRALLVDSSGRQVMVGPGAVGSAPVGNPLYIAGTDSSNLRALLVDTSGRQIMVGAAASGSALAGNPVLFGGSDGANVRTIHTDTSGNQVFAPLDDAGNISAFAFGGDNRLRVGQETLLFVDPFEGAAVNTVYWTQSTSGMTQAVASSAVQMNSNGNQGSGSYSILTTNRNYFFTGEFPLYAQFKARLVPQTNAVIELGFGLVATTAAPTNGVFLRIDAAGNMRAFINFGGAETQSATLGTLTTANYYSFEVFIYEDSVRIDIDNADGSTFAHVVLAIPVTQATPMTVAHFPAFVRVYNSAATSAVANVFVANLTVQQLDLNTNQAWEEQLSAAGRSAYQDPVTGTQSANYANSTAPVSATLSNTAAGYTTLGGLYQFAAVAGAETDYALFAYQVPTGYTLMVWSVTVSAVITGAQSSTAATLLQWGLAANSSAVSLATGAPNPPIRVPIGMQQAPKTANVGDAFTPADLAFTPHTPVTVNSGKYFHIILRMPIGNATASQIIRGTIIIDGVLI